MKKDEAMTCENCKHSSLSYLPEYYECELKIGDKLLFGGAELKCSPDFGCNKFKKEGEMTKDKIEKMIEDDYRNLVYSGGNTWCASDYETLNNLKLKNVNRAKKHIKQFGNLDDFQYVS